MSGETNHYYSCSEPRRTDRSAADDSPGTILIATASDFLVWETPKPGTGIDHEPASVDAGLERLPLNSTREVKALTAPLAAPTEVYTRPVDVDGFFEGWREAQKSASFHCPSFNDLIAILGAPSDDLHRIGVLRNDAGKNLILPFVAQSLQHGFTIGERRLGHMRLKALRLINPWMANGHAPSDIALLLTHVMQTEGVNLLDLGEIPESSDLRAGLDHLSWPARNMRLGRKNTIRWLIDLPGTFDEYLQSLPGKQRRNLNWKLRKVERDFECQVTTITAPADVPRFLEIGERISRKTYQWHVGQQLRNDEATRSRFVALAEQGRLRCYLLTLDGIPCAFERGFIEQDIFHSDTPGYDPEFARHSIGTVIFLNVLKDLIATSACRTFDFGTGGDETGFKSRFGNRQITCNSYYVVNAARPSAVLLLAGHRSLNSLKNMASSLIGQGALRAKIKRRLRKFGD
jgi:Acetyltransferase (GNAT) domain